MQPFLTTLKDSSLDLDIPILSRTETHISCANAGGGLQILGLGSVSITMTYASNSIISGNTYMATFVFGESIYRLYPYEYGYTTTIAISGAPGAPTIVSATPGNGLATLLFRAPTSIGSSAITSYTVTLNNDVISPITTTGADMSITATGLSNGTAYTFKVTATNAAGTGAASSISVTPRTAPGAPTIVSATPGVGLVTVRFTPPTSNGGSGITSYTVTSSPGGFTGTGIGTAINGSTDKSLTVTGLTNGTLYTFTVTATNAAGTGTPSSSSSATPRTVPNAPTAVSATPGNGSAIVTFAPPAFNGGANISGYTVTSNPGVFTGTGASSPITVSGLTNGTSYTFTVTATNEAGPGAASSSSLAVTPRTVPGAPTAVTAVPGNGFAIVSFTAPVSTGGAAISGYTVTSSPGGVTGTGTSTDRSITVNGLSNGTSYIFTVTATNVAGIGAPSSSSLAVTPRTVPGAPTGVSAIREEASAIVSFTAPAFDGGAAITGYTAISIPGGFTGTGTSSPITVTGLTEGTSYTFMVMATNEVGNSTKASSNPGVSCFVEGTRILTQAGYKAVEALKSDDVIVTADNRAVAFRLLKTTLPTTTDRIAPYLIQPHAFGRNLPSAPIRLSPTHKIQIGKGLWISAEKAARSNPLITQCEIGAPVTYYHVECKEFLRDNLVTEGLVVESFGSKRATGGRKDIYTWSKHLNAYTRVAHGSVVSKTATA